MATNPWPFHTYIRFNDFTYLKYITNVSSLYVHIFSEKPSCIQPVSVAAVRLSIRSMNQRLQPPIFSSEILSKI